MGRGSKISLSKATCKQESFWSRYLSWIITIFVLLGAGILAWIMDTDAKLLPKPTQDIYVVDTAKIVSESDKKQMLALGHDMNQRFGAQLVVATLDTLDGADIREYTNKLFRSWGIGSKEKNNGVLLLIAKKDRKFRIEVGYGLEGRITDGYAGAVLDGMKPDFKKENYSPAILTAYGKLASKIYEEYGAAPPPELAKLLTAGAPQSKQSQAPPAAEESELDFETIVGIIIIFAGIAIIMYIMTRMLGGVFYLLGSGGPSSGGYDSHNYDSDSYDSGSSDSFGGGDSGGGGSDDSW